MSMHVSICSTSIKTEISLGELIDKITILEIKSERILDAKKLENIWQELHALREALKDAIEISPELYSLMKELKDANEALWEIEDLIREKEREKIFDTIFINLARSIYFKNDLRYQIKRAINELLGSRLVEEKSYAPYN
jgi:hypothetical protein